ncbi:MULTISPECIES: DUF2169 family type VI secretion system accessory protein [Pseudomonas]|uniref:DUF2169 family type VI secretion system accessory protein n=1 Tax=Pseudomonas TaxID=286 RepID=UPI001379BE5D|nr:MULTISPECIES: DUF2169 domain-containing protein [Pseudomonas]WBM31146.1 DUF2169 domain-containing protein [Pseudomonas sp. NY11382]
MEFRNLTPFDVMCFSALAPDGQEHPVIAMKVGYRLEPIKERPGQCDAVVMDKDPVPLCRADTYHDEPGFSSVLEESDLAPFKPRCDVVVVGHSHAPEGRPAQTWEAGLRITSTRPRLEIVDPLPPKRAPGVCLTADELQEHQAAILAVRQRNREQLTPLLLLDKTLRFTGHREFHRNFLGWHLTEPDPAECVPLRWEQAFGGSSQIANPQFGHMPNAPEFLLNEVCFSNPLGCGWLEQRYERIHHEQTGEQLARLPAPQVEHLDAPVERLLRLKHPNGPLDASAMAKLAATYGCTPAGFGVVGRAWAPRLKLAGTYDQDWEESLWPELPHDFDFSYWNGAPADQQIPFPTPDAHIALFNLTSPALSKNGLCKVQLPGHRPFVLIRMTSGVMIPLPMLTDTLRIDTDAMTLSITHRISLPRSLDIRVLEARFETNPDAPIIRRKPRHIRESA